jgi:hypothetical protein
MIINDDPSITAYYLVCDTTYWEPVRFKANQWYVAHNLSLDYIKRVKRDVKRSNDDGTVDLRLKSLSDIIYVHKGRWRTIKGKIRLNSTTRTFIILSAIDQRTV